MARVTVEDCLEKLNNRFKLVLVASKRARQLSLYRVEPLVDVCNDKPTVVALREIAAGYLFEDDEKLLNLKKSNDVEVCDDVLNDNSIIDCNNNIDNIDSTNKMNINKNIDSINNFDKINEISELDVDKVDK